MKKWIAFLLIIAMMNSLVCYAEEPEVEELEVIIEDEIQSPEAELDIIPQDDSILLDNAGTLDLLPETDIDLDELLSDAEYSSDGSTYDDEAVSNEVPKGPVTQAVGNGFYMPMISIMKSEKKAGFIPGKRWSTSQNSHLACDFISARGHIDEIIYPIFDGEIIEKGYNSASGNYIRIKHDGFGMTFYSQYQHLKEKPSVSGTVYAGTTPIGIEGNTGITKGDGGYHLHLIVWSLHPYPFTAPIEEYKEVDPDLGGKPIEFNASIIDNKYIGKWGEYIYHPYLYTKNSKGEYIKLYNPERILDGSYIPGAEKKKVESISLNKTSVKLNFNNGESAQLVATILPDDAANKDVIWSSINTSVAMVTEDGLVQPVAAGETVITCTAQDGSGVSATCKVKVTKLDLNADKLDMYIGQTYTLKGTIDGKSVSCSFKSSNSKVVSVDKKGRITAKNVKKATKVTITATAPKKQGTETCDVVVHPKPKKISIKQVNSKTLNIGDTLDLSVKFDAPDALAKIYWSSSNEKVATVNAKGHVVAVGAGSVTISAKTKKIGGLTAKRLTAKIELTVNGPKKPTGIRISAPGTEVKIGEKLQLTAELIPENAEGSIKWESMNKKVAKVTQKGVVKPVKVGKVKIKATATKNANAWVTIEITVKESDAPTSISIGASKKSLYVSEKWWLNYKLNPADARTTLTFTSSDETVATVDGNGLITAIGAGTSTITVKTHNNKKASCRITVLPLPTIQLDRNSVSLKVGETYSLTCFVTGKVKEPAQFSSSDETVATVDNSGVITAINQGEAVITASLYDGISASCQVTVESATSDTFSGDLSIFLGKNLGEIRSVLGDSFSKEVMDYSKYMAYEGNNGIRVCVRKDDLMIVSLKIVASTPAEYNFYGVNARNSFQEVREVLCNQKGWDIVMYPGDPYNPQEEAYNCETKTEAWRTIGIYSKYYEHSMYLEIGYMDVAMCADRY